jgi:hypothetical protein
MARKNRTPAIAYLRTSSAANVGADKNSDKRQRDTIEAFARRAGFEVVGTYYDAAVARSAAPAELSDPCSPDVSPSTPQSQPTAMGRSCEFAS